MWNGVEDVLSLPPSLLSPPLDKVYILLNLASARLLLSVKGSKMVGGERQENGGGRKGKRRTGEMGWNGGEKESEGESTGNSKGEERRKTKEGADKGRQNLRR